MPSLFFARSPLSDDDDETDMTTTLTIIHTQAHAYTRTHKNDEKYHV